MGSWKTIHLRFENAKTKYSTDIEEGDKKKRQETVVRFGEAVVKKSRDAGESSSPNVEEDVPQNLLV